MAKGLINVGGGGSGGGAFTFNASTTTEGLDQNVTSGSSYSYMTAYITVYRPIKITHIYWDIKSAGTYTLKMFNQDITESKVISSNDNSDVEFALTSPLILTPGDHKITLYPSSPTTQYYNNSGAYSGTFWETSSSNFGGAEYGYTLPIKIKAYLGSWNT